VLWDVTVFPSRSCPEILRYAEMEAYKGPMGSVQHQGLKQKAETAESSWLMAKFGTKI